MFLVVFGRLNPQRYKSAQRKFDGKTQSKQLKTKLSHMKRISTLLTATFTLVLFACSGPKNNVSPDSYNMIFNNMTKADVEDILGEKQEKVFTSSPTDTTYRWWDGDGYTIYVKFSNGVVISKKYQDLDEPQQ
jgi:hypothetical protein